jgi:formylglycine-generating enzyme required for sulfatase activity
VEIPAGPFIYGENRETIKLPRYYISRYPITNSQYQVFIDAGGYSDKRWWQALEKPGPSKPRWTQINRPRERVNWYESVAFTRWLTAQLGFTITLPTEQQWEKAARGSGGRIYPWGNKFRSGYANIDETYEKKGTYYFQETSPVGIYPQGESSYRINDMGGNVWEWCLNKYELTKQTDPDQSGDARVLRGGSWNDTPVFASASFRYGHLPDNRNDDIGFRVVCSSPYTEH